VAQGVPLRAALAREVLLGKEPYLAKVCECLGCDCVK